MVILNKKRILIILACLVLSISIAELKGEQRTVETVALPVENKVIIIDARSRFSRRAVLLVMRE
ncbi:MAG: hypothetical protein J6A29_06055 [Clostridia bacterium]|nr:hypothetical protein [Clostridia bacterium]